MIDLAEGERLNRERTQGEWRVGIIPSHSSGYFGLVSNALGQSPAEAQHVCDIFPFGARGRAIKDTFVAHEKTAAFIAWSANNMDALLTTAREAVALRERVAELEGALAPFLAIYDAYCKAIRLPVRGQPTAADQRAAESERAITATELAFEEAMLSISPEHILAVGAALRSQDQEEKKDGR